MRKSKLLAGAAILALATAAQAQAGSLYVFGDSLSDTGNLYKLVGQPAAPYYNGRFSNGPIWVEYLPGLTGLSFTTANDHAYGGAYTGPLSYGGTNYGTNIGSPFLPGVTSEIAAFTATGQHFGRNDVVTLWAGANNYFLYSQFVTASPANATAIVTSAVTTTITQLNSDTQALIGLGAHTLIVPNLPALGVTPTYNTTASGIALGDAFSTAHNAALPVYMATLHQQTGANIIVLNEAQLLNTVIASPAAYGFSNVTAACIYTTACVTGITATQNTYLFWDNVHPTTHAQQLIAEYAAASLQGFEGLAVPAQLGATSAQDISSLLNNRLDALRGGATGFSYNMNGASGTNADPNQNLGMFVAVGGGFGNQQTTGTDSGFTYANATTALGMDYRFSPGFTGGLALGYGDNHANVSGGGTAHETSFTLSTYGLMTAGNIYVKVSGGYGDDWYETRRSGVMAGNISGKPKGATYMANLEAGYAMPAYRGVTLTPSLGVSYSNVSLQGYTETGDPLLTQTVQSQGFQHLIAAPGVYAAMPLNVAGLALYPYASMAAQILLSGQDSTFASAFNDAPGVSLTNAYPNQPRAWALFGVGASATLARQLSATVALSSTAFKTNSNDFTISGAANWMF